MLKLRYLVLLGVGAVVGKKLYDESKKPKDDTVVEPGLKGRH